MNTRKHRSGALHHLSLQNELEVWTQYNPANISRTAASALSYPPLTWEITCIFTQFLAHSRVNVALLYFCMMYFIWSRILQGQGQEQKIERSPK